MTRLINRLGDRMLEKLLPRTEAGACVPEAGQRCRRCKRRPACGGRRGDFRVDCYGHCKLNCGGC